jgi:hypothetical protein
MVLVSHSGHSGISAVLGWGRERERANGTSYVGEEIRTPEKEKDFENPAPHLPARPGPASWLCEHADAMALWPGEALPSVGHPHLKTVLPTSVLPVGASNGQTDTKMTLKHLLLYDMILPLFLWCWDLNSGPTP